MAAAFRANALGNDGITANTTTCAVTIPAGAAVGDVALVVLENNASATTITTAPSGWTLKSGPDDNTASNSWLYSKTIASGEPGSTVTWTFSATTRPVATMTVFSGATETGMTVATPNTDTTSVSSLTVPTIASVPAGAAVVALFGRNRTATSGTPADVTVASPYSQGGTDRAASAFAAGTNASTEVAYQLAASAGSYGGESLSITGGTSRGTTYLVSLPATGGPATVTGVTAVTRVSAQAGTGTAAATVTGATPVLRAAAQGGTAAAAATMVGATAGISVTGRPGVTAIVSGTVVVGVTALIPLVAASGTATAAATLTGRTATVRALAAPGSAAVPITVAGVTAAVRVRTPAGVTSVTTAPRYSWWNGTAWVALTARVWNGTAWTAPKVTVIPADT